MSLAEELGTPPSFDELRTRAELEAQAQAMASDDLAELDIDVWPVVQTHRPAGTWSAGLEGVTPATPFTGLGARR